jgi:threonine dehydratase
VVEPSGAVPLAALLAGRLDVRDQVVALVLSGGNVDPALFASMVG